MKVEIDIMKSIHAQSTNDIFKGEFNGFLMASVIDKIDNNSIAVGVYLFLEMFSCRFNLRQRCKTRIQYSFFEISKNSQLRFVFDIHDFRPVKRDTPPCLHIAHPLLSGWTRKQKHLLGLVEIRRMSLSIDSSGEKPCANSKARTTRYQSDGKCLVVCESMFDVQESKDDWENKGIDL
jgi:hypothetical protein